VFHGTDFEGGGGGEGRRVGRGSGGSKVGESQNICAHFIIARYDRENANETLPSLLHNQPPSAPHNVHDLDTPMAPGPISPQATPVCSTEHLKAIAKMNASMILAPTGGRPRELPPDARPQRTAFQFDPIEDALAAFAHGDFLLVMDDEDRENEGDLILAASACSTEKMAWMIKHTRCVVGNPDSEMARKEAVRGLTEPIPHSQWIHLHRSPWRTPR
jgi:hypothetical protein